MPHSDPNNVNAFWLTLILFKDVLLGLIGGAISYLFDFSRAKRQGNGFAFQVSSMVINMCLGAFVAYIVGSLIPIDTAGRDAIVGMSGVTSYQILLIAESRFATWIFNKITGDDVKHKKEKETK